MAGAQPITRSQRSSTAGPSPTSPAYPLAAANNSSSRAYPGSPPAVDRNNPLEDYYAPGASSRRAMSPPIGTPTSPKASSRGLYPSASTGSLRTVGQQAADGPPSLMPSRAAPAPPSQSSQPSALVMPVQQQQQQPFGAVVGEAPGTADSGPDALPALVSPLSISEKRRSGGASAQRTSYAPSSRPPFHSHSTPGSPSMSSPARGPSGGNKLKRPSNPPHMSSSALQAQQSPSQQHPGSPYRPGTAPTPTAPGLGGAWEFVDADATTGQVKTSLQAPFASTSSQSAPSTAVGGLPPSTAARLAPLGGSHAAAARHSLLNDPNTSAAASMAAYDEAPIQETAAGGAALQPSAMAMYSPTSPGQDYAAYRGPYNNSNNTNYTSSQESYGGGNKQQQQPATEELRSGSDPPLPAAGESGSRMGKRRPSDLKGQQGGTIKGAIGNFFGGMSGRLALLSNGLTCKLD